ncbi:GrpE protein -like protein [Escovopsis weberi]|uniref:GrpE protein homolog n=1 Tax=Escovopsis weberi TaxID=150374 RepID=A0A0M8N935_ESCWE|nr:GrpE protein -like protein [Escovopsis weberi]
MLRQALTTSSRGLRAMPRATACRAALQAQSRASAPASPLRASQRTIGARWYSEAKEAQEAKDTKDGEAAAKAEGAEKNGAKGDADVVAELRKSLEAKDAEARDWKDKCLRTVADFRNLQDRTAREVKSARDFAIQKFAKDLVDSVDNLDRALATVPAEKLAVAEADRTEHQKDLANLYEGLKMTESILMQTLARHGLERLSPEGDKFNPNEHEATFMAPQPGKEDNTVFFVQQKGFKLNGRVLRAAQVGVVKNT